MPSVWAFASEHMVCCMRHRLRVVFWLVLGATVASKTKGPGTFDVDPRARAGGFLRTARQTSPSAFVLRFHKGRRVVDAFTCFFAATPKPPPSHVLGRAATGKGESEFWFAVITRKNVWIRPLGACGRRPMWVALWGSGCVCSVSARELPRDEAIGVRVHRKKCVLHSTRRESSSA